MSNHKGKQKNAESKKILLKEYVKYCVVIWLLLSVFATIFVTGFNSETVTPQYPAPTSYFFVNDYSEALSQETEEWIQNQAVALYEKTKAQIVVAVIPDTQTQSLEDYSYTLANDWGIGDAELNNGVLILFTTEEPHVRLEVGKGLEGCLNDAKSGRILDKWAVEAKDDGRWNEAAINTFVATAQVVYEEYGLEQPENLVTVSSVSEEQQTNTMADAAFPDAIVEKNENPLWMQIVIALCFVWGVGLIPYILVCIFIRINNFSYHVGPGGYSGTWYSGSSFGDGGGFSGGGGGFGGGGASR